MDMYASTHYSVALHRLLDCTTMEKNEGNEACNSVAGLDGLNAFKSFSTLSTYYDAWSLGIKAFLNSLFHYTVCLVTGDLSEVISKMFTWS